MKDRTDEQLAAVSESHEEDFATSECGDTNVSTGSHRGSEVHSELAKLAAADNRNVRIWKTLVATIIAIAGVIVTIGIYKYLKDQENKEIEDSVSGNYSSDNLK